jgi:curli biogenesis system outer membrane secretion channel CsgG
MVCKPIAALLVVVCLAACTTTSIAKTTKQKYFAAKQDYATVLTAAERYVTACREKPTDRCVETSEAIQRTDLKVFMLIKAGDSVVNAEDQSQLAGYLTAIDIALNELRAYAMAQISDPNKSN